MILPSVAEDIFPFCYVAVIFLGLCLGSFATALIYRIPRGVPWIWDRSKGASRSACPSCNATLGVLDLIPIFSWLFARGKCRHCGASISWAYPLTEIICLILVVGLYSIWGNQWATIPILLLVPFLVAHIVIDWKHMILPDDINIVLFILAVFFLALGGAEDEWPSHLIAAILLPAIFWGVSVILKIWKGREALGQGDLKFLPSAGLLIGLQAFPSYLVFSGLLGLATGLYYVFKEQKGVFPFGPALVFSLLLHLFLTGYGFE